MFDVGDGVSIIVRFHVGRMWSEREIWTRLIVPPPPLFLLIASCFLLIHCPPLQQNKPPKMINKGMSDIRDRLNSRQKPCLD